MTAVRLLISAPAAACLILGNVALMASPVGTLSANAAHAESRCGDFLAEMHHKPEHLRFVACRSFPDRQGKPLRAVYRVNGRHAAVAEAAMIEAFGLEALRHVCCRWEAPPRWFKIADGREFLIIMVSDETTVVSREDWADIPVFEITVETLTDAI